jgi:hypothetical protein
MALKSTIHSCQKYDVWLVQIENIWFVSKLYSQEEAILIIEIETVTLEVLLQNNIDAYFVDKYQNQYNCKAIVHPDSVNNLISIVICPSLKWLMGNLRKLSCYYRPDLFSLPPHVTTG